MGLRGVSDKVKKGVLWDWGVFPPETVAEKYDLTVSDCIAIVRSELGVNRGKGAGYTTLRQLCRDTGYDPHQVRRVLKKMSLNVYRSSDAPNSPYWFTPEQVTRIVNKLISEEYPISRKRAAVKIGCGVFAIDDAVEALGLRVATKRKKGAASRIWELTEDQYNKIKEYVRPDGVSVQEVAQQLGIHRFTVTRIARNLGLELKKSGRKLVLAREAIDKIAEDYHGRKSVKITRTTIAEQVGCSKGLVNTVARELGIIPTESKNEIRGLTQEESDRIVVALSGRRRK